MWHRHRRIGKFDWLAVVVLMALLLVDQGLAAQAPGTFPMPSVIGLTVEEAQKRVTDAGKSVGTSSAKATVTESRPSDQPADRIISQDPDAGTPMRPYLDDVGGVYGQVSFTVVLSTGPEPAPDFRGQTSAQARRSAHEYSVRLSFGDDVRDPITPVGHVSQQRPDPGQPMTRRQVAVNLSAGFPLPDYTGKPLAFAQRTATRLRFALEVLSEENREFPRGIIVAQQPPARTLLPLDTPVRVTVSEGWPTPDFRQMEIEAARSLASDKQVSLAIAGYRQDRGARPGSIIGQVPLPGELLPPGQPVKVVVSSGYPTPNFVDLAEKSADSLAAREDVILEKQRAADPRVNVGTVMSQSPEPGEPLPQDSRVTVTLSSGWPVPDFVDKPRANAEALAADNDITLAVADPREDFVIGAGRVVAQAPAAGATVPKSRRVEIALSLGWPVAPDAVGRPVGALEKAFLDRYPHASVELSERVMTLKSTGVVLAQRPAAGVKLGRDQRLKLVVAAKKPPWLLPGVGLLALVAAGGGVASLRRRSRLKKARSSQREAPAQADDTSLVRLRVTRDPGEQTNVGMDDVDDGIKLKVTIDPGEQTVGPADPGGNQS